MNGHDDLTTVGMPPFLMAALLTDLKKAMSSQHTNYFRGIPDRETVTHGSATSNTLAPAESCIGDGSNQSSRASRALRAASSSLSPADAHPGISGKNAAHRFVSGSCS